MKPHFCPVEKTVISYEGECNWCGENENGMKERNYDKWLLLPDEDTRLPTDIGGIHIQKLKAYLDALESRVEELEKAIEERHGIYVQKT